MGASLSHLYTPWDISANTSIVGAPHADMARLATCFNRMNSVYSSIQAGLSWPRHSCTTGPPPLWSFSTAASTASLSKDDSKAFCSLWGPVSGIYSCLGVMVWMNWFPGTHSVHQQACRHKPSSLDSQYQLKHGLGLSGHLYIRKL